MSEPFATASINEPEGTIQKLQEQKAPPPAISSISPEDAVVLAPDFDLTVTGTGFTSTSVISFNAVDVPTTFVSATELTTTVASSTVADPQLVSVTVKNGAEVSNAAEFEFTAVARSSGKKRK